MVHKSQQLFVGNVPFANHVDGDIFFALFLGLWAGHKIQAAQIAVVFLGSALLLRGRISAKAIIAIVLVILSPVVLQIIIHPAGFERGKIYVSLLDRAFVAPARITYQYCEVFPEGHPHTYGRGNTYMGFLLGRSVVSLPLIVSNYYSETGFTWSYTNTGFIGVGWAEFGIVGVLLFSLLAGILSQFVQNFITRKATLWGKTPQLVWFHAAQIPIWTVTFVSNSILQIFVGQGLLISLILVWICNVKWASKQAYLPEKEMPSDESDPYSY